MIGMGEKRKEEWVWSVRDSVVSGAEKRVYVKCILSAVSVVSEELYVNLEDVLKNEVLQTIEFYWEIDQFTQV